MSLPPELRVLCFQLSNTPTSDLPQLTPTLIRHVARCQIPLSSPTGNASKADASAAQVQVHKLKTQLSTLLNGKSPEGRFAAVVLIKAVIEVGGWEILRGSEPWVRGLLAILGKLDSAATKELCIIALTKIYCMTHQYQTLVREITTPTLPTFVTSCLNLLSSKSSGRVPDIPTSLAEVVFGSFATLVPRHTTILRPFASQIRAVAKPYLAPTLSDGISVPLSLTQNARRLIPLLHQTVAKNAGGEEWSKAVRELVKDIHVTADHVFRAVVEDWESTVGYVSEPIDVNQELSGGARTPDDFPQWNGIDAGVERIVGLLGTLEQYFRGETSFPVSIPVGAVMDMITRMLSIAIPSLSQSSGRGSGRLHPAIDRDERDTLWTGMPQIYVGTVELISAMADRFQEGFMPLAQGSLDQLAWVFQHGKHEINFRLAAYRLISRLLPAVGNHLGKGHATKYSGIIRSCCDDILPIGLSAAKTGSSIKAGEKRSHDNMSNANQNADTFLRKATDVAVERPILSDTDLVVAASELLPLFVSHFPQQHMDIPLRHLIERTAILSHNKDAMLASILNPFIGKNGRALTSMLPHLSREFGNHAIVEILLRPRLPQVPSSTIHPTIDDVVVEESGYEDEDEDMDADVNEETLNGSEELPHPHGRVSLVQELTSGHHGIGEPTSLQALPQTQPGFGSSKSSSKVNVPSIFNKSLDESQATIRSTLATVGHGSLSSETQVPGGIPVDAHMGEAGSDSDDESVHLTMQLDTDSESDG